MNTNVIRRIRRLTLRAKIALVLGMFCVGLGLFGPFFAPYDPTEILGRSYEQPTREHVLGLDALGRDAFSRFLSGGRTAFALAAAAVSIGYGIGLFVGLTSAYYRGNIDNVMMRAVDVLLAFPGLIFTLLFVAAFGISAGWLVIAVGLAGAPRIARLVRAAALEVVVLPYIEASRARGESVFYINAREVLPNILHSISVDFGIRLASAVLLVASVSFLGFGIQPPTPDWGLMVSENRGGITVQPWPVVAPAMIVGLLTLSINIFLDSWRSDRQGNINERALAER